MFVDVRNRDASSLSSTGYSESAIGHAEHLGDISAAVLAISPSVSRRTLGNRAKSSDANSAVIEVPQLFKPYQLM